MILQIFNFDEFYVTDFCYVELNFSKKEKQNIKKAQKILKENKYLRYVFFPYYPDGILNEDKQEAKEKIEATTGLKIFDSEIYFVSYVKGSYILLESNPFKL